MGATRTVELPPTHSGQERTTEMSNLEWALQFVKLKIQEMVRYYQIPPLLFTNHHNPDFQWPQDRPMWCHPLWL